MEKVKIIAGRSNKPLAESISKCLGISLVNCSIEKFPSTEIQIKINEDVRGFDVFIVQTGGSNTHNSINDYIMETLLLIDTCNRSGVNSVSTILANYPYSRSDKKDEPRVPIGASLIANILKAAGCHRIISMDLHSGQIQGFTNLPFDNLYGIKLHINKLKTTIFNNLTQEEINSRFVLVSLDVGGAKRIRDFAERLEMPHAIMDKQRDYSKIGKITQSILVGCNIKGKIAICIDDMCDTCGTVTSGIKDLREHGATGAIILATHGIFSEPAIERLNSCNFIQKIIVIDTLDQTHNLNEILKLEVVSAGPLFAEVIKRIVEGGSISQLFI